MVDNRRIPKNLTGFDTYIRRAVPYIQAGAPVKHGIRLGLTNPELTAAQTFLDSWWTGIPATPGAYDLHSNYDTKTRTTRNRVEGIMKNFTTFFSPLLTRMSTTSAITETDRSNLNLPARDATPTRRGAIGDSPLAGLKSFASARIKVRCRIDQDASRASMHPLADAIEMRYQIGGTQPANALVCPGISISKKAMFTVDADVDNDGKKFFGFVRYVNLTNPENNGPWGTLQTATVQG